MTDNEGPDHLQLFADRYGLSLTVLTYGSYYAIQNAQPGFTGTIDTLQIISRGGRFGNIFYQLLHATLLAIHFRWSTIEFFQFPGGAEPIHIHDLTYRYRSDPGKNSDGGATLAGVFFQTYHFGDLLRQVRPNIVRGVLKLFMWPLYARARRTAQVLEPSTLVVHFRSGDVFHTPHIWYVQPPASFYAKAIDHARSSLGIKDVVLVFEDRRNPAIGLTEDFLRANNIPYRVQSGDFVDDLACLMGAHHLVASYGTLCEAAALLSEHLRSYTAFRTLDSQEHLHGRSRPLFPAVLAACDIMPIRIDDAGEAYIPRLKWDGSPEQLEMLRTYPIDKLTIATDATGQTYNGPTIVIVPKSAAARAGAAGHSVPRG